MIVPRSERLAVGAAAAAFLTLVFFRGGVFIFPFPSGSNGVFFDEAHRVLAGEVMYRDFFEFVGPGTAYLNALALLVCGPRIAALGGLQVALGTLLALLFHHLSALTLPGRWRLLPPSGFVVLVYAPYTFGDHKWPALCLGLLGLVALCGRPAAAPAAFRAGVLLGGSVLFTQDLGLGLGAGVFLFLLWQRPPARTPLAFAVGLGLPPLLVLGFFAWKAGAGRVLDDWLVFPFTHYRELNRFRLTASPSLRTVPRDLTQLLLAGAGILGALAALRRSPEPAGPPRLLALAGLCMLMATGHRGLYPMGLAVQTAPLIPLAVRVLADGGGAALTLLRRGLLAVVALGLLHGLAGFVVWRQFLQPMVFETHRAGGIWTARPMPELLWIESRTAPGQATFLLPARGGHYFLTQTRDVTPFPYLIEGQHTPEQARAALLRIEAASPEVGLWDQRPWPRSSPETAGPLDLLYHGLSRGYSLERLPSGVYLLSRKRP